jgi:hydrogenase/urease accessory protein HupE
MLLWVLVIALVLPGAALAHGIGTEADRPAPGYVPLGFRHMLAGWDHLLFILGIVLLARNAWRAAKLISLFVLGHSITLLVATVAGWTVNPELVDVVIALSVAYVGIRILRSRPTSWHVTGAIIFAFGLAHGLGLSTRLQGIALPHGADLVARVVAFNVGVELGQLSVLAAVAAVVLAARRLAPTRARILRLAPAAVAPAAGALVLVGTAAAGVLGLQAAKPERETAQPTVPAPLESNSCVESDSNEPRSLVGGHPDKAFYGPGEAPDGESLLHVLGDGYLVVLYRRNITERQQRLLAGWAEANTGVIAAPGLVEMPDAIHAINSSRILKCLRFDLGAVDRFRADWRASLRP